MKEEGRRKKEEFMQLVEDLNSAPIRSSIYDLVGDT
jgi:hypothetical protein